MAKVLILGGGFAGVVAAQRLANELGDDHQITMVSRTRKFVFYPALVRLAFGQCEPDDVTFDLRKTMLNRRVNFIEGEVARINPDERKVIIAHGEVEGQLSYDYLIVALGRRLATERIAGFYEHAHHLLTVEQALRFGDAVAQFEKGRIVIGECPEARLSVPVYETAFAVSRFLESRGKREAAKITVVSPNPPGIEFDDKRISDALLNNLKLRNIEFIPEFPISRISQGVVSTNNGHGINFDLLMLIPPFRGASAAACLGITNELSYINVDSTMRVVGLDHTYAVGDCVNFSGPKMGHMAVRQGEIAAANVIDAISKREPSLHYVHEIKLIIDTGESDSIYMNRDIWTGEPATFKQGRFWSWAKRGHGRYWEMTHS